MKKYLFFLCMIFISCNKSHVEKANNLIESSYRYHSIGPIKELDSVVSYKEPFMMRCAALQMEWYDDSVMKTTNYHITQEQAKELRSNTDIIYKLRTEATRKELEYGLSGIKETFVGFSATKKISGRKVVVYFDEKLKRILGVEYDN